MLVQATELGRMHACVICEYVCAGYYGADCSLSLDAAGRPELLGGLGYHVRSKRPHVYVYELPPSFNTWCEGG